VKTSEGGSGVTDMGGSEAGNLKERAMPEMTSIEKLVLSYIEKAKKIHVNKLFESIREEYRPLTDTQIVSAIWSLKDRRKINVSSTGELEIVRSVTRLRERAAAV
jgi:hypothetical protein